MRLKRGLPWKGQLSCSIWAVRSQRQVFSTAGGQIITSSDELGGCQTVDFIAIPNNNNKLFSRILLWPDLSFLDWSIISAAGGIVGLSMVFLEQGYLLSLQQFRSIMFEAPASSIRFVAFWWCLKNSKHYKVASAAAEQHCIKHIYTHLFRIGEHFFFSLKEQNYWLMSDVPSEHWHA